MQNTYFSVSLIALDLFVFVDFSHIFQEVFFCNKHQTEQLYSSLYSEDLFIFHSR